MTKYSLTSSDLCSAPKGGIKKCSKTIFGVLFVCLFVGALALYLLQVNSIAAKGFEVRELEQQINELEEGNEKLAVRIIELKTMNELEGKVAQLEMVPIDNMAYYDTTGQVVARR